MKDLKISLDISHFGQKNMWNYFSKNQFFEPETSLFLLSVLNEGDCFIDIGAHIGYFSLLAASLVGSGGNVISFEPEDANYRDLLNNINLNGFDHIDVFNFPLDSTNEKKTFFINSDTDGGHALWDVSLHPFNQKSRRDRFTKIVTVRTLDSILKENNSSQIKLIKIDAEGAEYNILQGGMDTILGKRVPYIICEINRSGLAQMGSSESHLRQLIKNSGYDTYFLADNHGTPAIIRLKDEYSLKSGSVFNLIFAMNGIEIPSQFLIDQDSLL